MKKGIVILLLLAAHVLAVGQAPKVTIKWGDLGKEKVFKPMLRFSVLGSVNGMICAVKTNGGNTEYALYDKDMKFIENLDVHKSYFGKGAYLDNGCFLTDNKVFQVYMENDFAKNGSVPTYLAEVDLKTMKHKTITEVGKRQPNKGFQWSFMGYYIRQSKDRTKFAFVANAREYKIDIEKGSPDFQVIVFDSEHKKIQEQTWTYPLEATKIEFESVIVDNEGNVFLQAKVKSKDLKKNTGQDFQLALVAFPVNGKPGYQTFDGGENVVSSLRLATLGNGKVTGGGFFSEKKSGERAKGSFFISYDGNTNKVEKKVFLPFAETFKDGFVRGGGKAELPEVYLDAVEPTPDGGILIFGEQNISPDNVAGPTSGNVYGRSKEIVIVRYDANGKLVFEMSIPKFQRANMIGMFSEQYYSYIYSFDGAKIRLLFNDDIKNLNNYDASKTVECRGFNDATAVVAEVDAATGSYKKYALFKATEAGVILYPMVSEAIAPNRFVIFAGDITGSSVKSYRIGEITFN